MALVQFALALVQFVLALVQFALGLWFWGEPWVAQRAVKHLTVTIVLPVQQLFSSFENFLRLQNNFWLIVNPVLLPLHQCYD